MGIPIITVAEDQLLASLGKKILSESGEFDIHNELVRGGENRLKAMLDSCIGMSKSGLPVLFLTDLDNAVCAGHKVADWMSGKTIPDGLLFRVAVREAESWVMADSFRFSRFLGVSQRLISSNPDNLVNPKSDLIKLARRSRLRELRDGIPPQTRLTAQVGPEYNHLLTGFVEQFWDLNQARCNSESLNKACIRVAELSRSWAF